MTTLEAGGAIILTTFLVGVIWGLASAMVTAETRRRMTLEVADLKVELRPLEVEGSPDRLAEAVRAWLADPRPAWDTVEAFERDVAHALGVAVPPEPGEFYRQTLIGADGDEVVVTGWRRT